MGTTPREPETEAGRSLLVWLERARSRGFAGIPRADAILAIEAEAAEAAVTHTADMEHAAQERQRVAAPALPAGLPDVFVCRAPDGRIYLNEEGRDEPLYVLPTAIGNLLAYGASPPEYPGLVLVPAEDIDALRAWLE